MLDRQTTSQTRRAWWVAATLTLFIAACDTGASQVDTGQSVEAEASRAATETTSSAAEATNSEPTSDNHDMVNEDRSSESQAAAATAASNPPDLSGLEVVSLPALGGLRLGLDPDVSVYTEGDMVLLTRPGIDAVLVIARVSAGSDLSAPILTIEALIDEAGDFASTEVTASDEQLVALGRTLDLYSFAAPADAPSPPPQGVFGSRQHGLASNVGWTPAPHADVFLSEVANGVLAFGVVAQSRAAVEAGHDFLTEVASTSHMLTPDGSLEGPPDGLFSVRAGAPWTPPTAASDGPPILIDLFSPIEPGEYRTGNLGRHTSFTVGDDWWVMPNATGFIVLADTEFGPPLAPGDRDVVFLQNTNAISGLTASIGPNGPMTAIDDIEEFLASPPSNLQISNVDKAAVVGGAPAVSFDVRIDPSATCQHNDPCGFVLTTPNISMAKDIKAGSVTRVWWIPGTRGGVLTIGASTSEADVAWLDDRASGLVESIVFG